MLDDQLPLQMIFRSDSVGNLLLPIRPLVVLIHFCYISVRTDLKNALGFRHTLYPFRSSFGIYFSDLDLRSLFRV